MYHPYISKNKAIFQSIEFRENLDTWDFFGLLTIFVDTWFKYLTTVWQMCEKWLSFKKKIWTINNPKMDPKINAGRLFWYKDRLLLLLLLLMLLLFLFLFLYFPLLMVLSLSLLLVLFCILLWSITIYLPLLNENLTLLQRSKTKYTFS